MKDSKYIKGTLSTRFSLGRHVSLMMQLHGAISKVPAEKMLVTDDDINLWKKNIDLESDLAKDIEATEETILLKKKNAERNRILTNLFTEIRTAAQSVFPAKSDPGMRLKLIVDSYKGLVKEAYDTEMAHIFGLITDLSKPEPLADVNALNLQPLVDMLKTSNEEFSTIFSKRNHSAAADLLPKSIIIRRKNEELMSEIFHHIEAAYVSLTVESDRQLVAGLIDLINQIVSDAKSRHKESQAQKKHAKKKKKKDDGNKIERETEDSLDEPTPSSDNEKPSDNTSPHSISSPSTEETDS